MIENKSIKIKAIIYGVFAVIIVLMINWIVLALLDYPEMALDIISKYYILFILLFGGFGLQVGLFTYFHKLNAISCSTTVTSGGISTVSMILCCSHYLLNILPFLGAFIGSSSLLALAKYTPYFLWLGIISNAVGIGVLFYQKNKYAKRKNEK